MTSLPLTASPSASATPTERDDTRSSWRLQAAIAVAAAALRLIPAAQWYGTSDVQTWDLLGRLLLNGENFYATQLHNWPPLWIYFTAAAVLAHDATNLSFSLLVKLPPIAADAFIAVLLYRAANRLGWAPNQAALAGIAYAANPVSILITGYHGQFDSLMLAPTFLAWYLWDSRRWRRRDSVSSGRRSVVGSALALGIGIWFKPVPLLLLPVFLPRISTWPDRMLYTGLALAPAAIGTLPFFLLWPSEVAANFLGYSSWFGQWGYPVLWMVFEFLRNGTVPWWLPDPDYVSLPLRLMYESGRWVLLSALAATWWILWRRRTDVLQRIVSTFAVFCFATNGFGVQYLLWIVPFALVARDRWLWPFTFAATALLVVAYTGGLAYQPFAVSPDNGPSGREFIVKLASIPAWMVCGLWTWCLLRPRRHTRTNYDSAVIPHSTPRRGECR